MPRQIMYESIKVVPEELAGAMEVAQAHLGQRQPPVEVEFAREGYSPGEFVETMNLMDGQRCETPRRQELAIGEVAVRYGSANVRINRNFTDLAHKILHDKESNADSRSRLKNSGMRDVIRPRADRPNIAQPAMAAVSMTGMRADSENWRSTGQKRPDKDRRGGW